MWCWIPAWRWVLRQGRNFAVEAVLCRQLVMLACVGCIVQQVQQPKWHRLYVSALQYEDYKRDLRLRLRAMADTETAAPGQPELLFV